MEIRTVRRKRKIKGRLMKMHWRDFYTELFLDENDLLISKGTIDFGKATINLRGIICVGGSYYRRKQFLKIAERFLFPKRKGKFNSGMITGGTRKTTTTARS